MSAQAEAFAVSDLQGRFYLFDKAAEQYIGLTEWLGGSGCIYLPDAQTLFAREELPLARALRGLDSLDVSMFVRGHTASSGRLIVASCRPLRDQSGELQGAVMSWRDGKPNGATELAASHQPMLENTGGKRDPLEDRFKSKFLDSMSHELRTPLNAIIGFSELLEEQAVGRLNGRQLDHIRAVLNSGRQLLRMVNELLQVSNFDPTRMVLTFEWVGLGSIIGSVAVVVRTQAEAASVSLTADIEPGLPLLYLDVMRTKQVLFTLLSTAVDLAGKGGRVKLVASVDGSRVKLTLDAAPQKQQVQSAHQAEREDLAITRRLIEMHGGAMSVEGTADNGLRFTVALPRLRGEEPLAQEPVGDADASHSLVLIVDDDAKASTLIANQLHAGGVSVAFARNAVEALRRAEQLKPLAITLDLRMPGEDGFEVLNKLRAAPATASIPVIVISILDERRMALAHGAVDFICKPVSGDLLLTSLERMGIPVCRIKGRRIQLIAKETEAMHQVEGQLRMAGCKVDRMAPELARPGSKSADLVIFDMSNEENSPSPLIDEFARATPGSPSIAIVGDWDKQVASSEWPTSVVTLTLEDAVRADRLVRAIHRALDTQ